MSQPYWNSSCVNYLYGPKINPPPNYPQSVVNTPYTEEMGNCIDQCLCSSIRVPRKKPCLSHCQQRAVRAGMMKAEGFGFFPSHPLYHGDSPCIPECPYL